MRQHDKKLAEAQEAQADLIRKEAFDHAKRETALTLEKQVPVILAGRARDGQARSGGS